MMKRDVTAPPVHRRNLANSPARAFSAPNRHTREHDEHDEHDHAEVDPVLMFFGISCVFAVILGLIYHLFH
jgi:hypothetical protein